MCFLYRSKNTVLIKTATDVNLLKQMKPLLISYNCDFWGRKNAVREHWKTTAWAWVENCFVKGGIWATTWKLKVKRAKMIGSCPVRSADAAAARWWISANICSLPDLYSCSRMHTDI